VQARQGAAPPPDRGPDGLYDDCSAHDGVSLAGQRFVI
jgi:hypothetical protein